jgi:hypothetical protein
VLVKIASSWKLLCIAVLVKIASSWKLLRIVA